MYKKLQQFTSLITTNENLLTSTKVIKNTSTHIYTNSKVIQNAHLIKARVKLKPFIVLGLMK
jgi:hypothetical protein